MMKKIMAYAMLASVLAFTVGMAIGTMVHSNTVASKPLGVALQQTAGNGYEVIFNPTTGIYTIEPR